MKKQIKKLNEPSIIEGLFEKLTSSNFYIFPVKGKINVSDSHGVYIIYNPQNEVLHVGNTSGRKGLNQRLYNHISYIGFFYENI
jgi:hypothetical protein